jgi:hypothetical protein
MTVFFMFIFFEFAQFSSGMSTMQVSPIVKKEVGSLFKKGSVKIDFADGNPKLFLSISTPFNNKVIKAKEGELILGKDEMIVGFEEGMMMKREKLINKPGDTLTNFFGISEMKVVGILERTGTILDSFHIVNKETYSGLKNEGVLRTVTEEDNGVELFYTISSIVPTKLNKDISIGSLLTTEIQGKKYTPMYFGNTVGVMMIKEGEFKKQGVTVEELGVNVIVAGILPKTGTALDKIHFAGPNFTIGN